MKMKYLFLALFALVALGACKKADQTTSSSTGDKVGVVECDEYIEKYQNCLNDKVPEASREMMKSSFQTATSTWKQAAQTPEGKASLASACKAALDAARQAMTMFGCSM